MNQSIKTASLILQNLWECGISDICTAPGSRNAPFLLMMEQLGKNYDSGMNYSQYNKKIRLHIHFDERATAFVALGIARNQEFYSAVITTSGSAGANLFPAVMEAAVSGIPFVVVTSDRPNELLHCGANQTCVQERMFGEYALFMNVVPEDADYPDALRNRILSLWHEALVRRIPLHLNVQLREPLYENVSVDALCKESRTISLPERHDNCLEMRHSFFYDEKGINIIFQELRGNSSLLENDQSALVIAGALMQGEADAILNIVKTFKVPVLADVQSGLRGKAGVLPPFEYALGHDENFKKWIMQRSAIIIFGGRLISKKLLSMISKYSGKVIFVSRDLRNINAIARKALQITGDFKEIAQKLYEMAKSSKLLTYKDNKIKFLSAPIISLKEPFNEINAVKMFARTSDSALFIGNSMTARIMDALAENTPTTVYASRGVSGIDGLIAGAAGASVNGAVTLVLGDQSALYDLSSIALLRTYNVRLVIINNNGGNIFTKFPVTSEDTLDKFFINPQNLSFKGCAEMFGVRYNRIFSVVDLEKELQNGFKSGVVECIFLKKQGSSYFFNNF